MDGFQLVDYKRISTGLILSFISWLLLPVGFAAMLALAMPMLRAGIPLETVLQEILAPESERMLQANYFFETMQEAIRVIGMLAIIAGLSATEAASGYFRHARAWFIARIISDVIFSLSDSMLLSLSTRGGIMLSDLLAETIQAASTVADAVGVIVIGYGAYRSLLLGYGEALRRLGDDAQAAKAEGLCRPLTLASAATLLAALLLAAERLIRPEGGITGTLFLPVLLMLLALFARAVVQIGVIRRAHAAARVISEVSR